MRVIETVVVGRRKPVHTHRWASVGYVLNGSQLVRPNGDGAIVLDTRADDAGSGPPTSYWAEPLPPDSLENIGVARLRGIMAELERPVVDGSGLAVIAARRGGLWFPVRRR